MACVHAATAKASTTAKCLITLSSLQWLTIANNDGERRSVQSARLPRTLLQNPPIGDELARRSQSWGSFSAFVCLWQMPQRESVR
jgi:hypothetical protein